MKTQLKSQARVIRQLLAHHHLTLGVRHSLEVLAAMYGLPDWNTLCTRPTTPLLAADPATAAARERLRQCGLHVDQEICKQLYNNVLLILNLRLTPSRGKTTILKDLVYLKLPAQILVIDTANEISGDGTRHPGLHRVRKWPGC